MDRAQDKNFWSVRVNADIRLIVHKTSTSLLLAYVDHHDNAYKWAERRKIERHPTTGAMQLVEVRERVEEISFFTPKPEVVAVVVPKPKLFDNLRKFELMSFGVPEEWVDEVRRADEDSIFDVIQHLPQEAQEALLKLAVGEKPEPAPVPTIEADPFTHPDAQRSFRFMDNAEELQRALDFPWEKWAVYLHPAQETLVAHDFNGPARVSGSAGTGKTIVALHGAAHLARLNPDKKVLLTTFSKALANALKRKLEQLLAGEKPILSRITVQSISAVGFDLYSARFGQPNLATTAIIRSLLHKAADDKNLKFTENFLFGEWSDVVDAWQLKSWDDYRDVTRLGRKTRLGVYQRESLWQIFETVRTGLASRKLVTWADIYGRLSQAPTKAFDFAVVDEAQDLGIAEARFLTATCGIGQNALFFAGDLGQRIFQQPFSWKSLGIDIRGRSTTLRINYRTSHQIRTQADRLLPNLVSDVDGNSESRKGTVSMFQGVSPTVNTFADEAEERIHAASWITDLINDGYAPHEIGIIVRSEAQLKRARAIAKTAQVDAIELTDFLEPIGGSLAISTMHFAKGLEFRAVAVVACDDEIIPLQERIEEIADDADLDAIYETERHLLYVACTRARDRLFVSGLAPGSEFLADLV